MSKGSKRRPVLITKEEEERQWDLWNAHLEKERTRSETLSKEQKGTYTSQHS